jgi:hypothetical protein
MMDNGGGAMPPITDGFPHRGSDDTLAVAEVSIEQETVDEVGVVTVRGPLERALPRLQRTLLHTLADDPRGTVCDLSAAVGPVSVEHASMLLGLSEQAGMLPCRPLVLVCGGDLGGYLEHELPGVERAADRRTALARASARLPGHLWVRRTFAADPRSCATARHTLERTWRRWGIATRVDEGLLVVNEMMRAVLTHSLGPVRVGLSLCGQSPRLSVCEAATTLRSSYDWPASRDELGALDRLLLIEQLCTQWGVLPTREGGRSYWAVL